MNVMTTKREEWKTTRVKGKNANHTKKRISFRVFKLHVQKNWCE